MKIEESFGNHKSLTEQEMELDPLSSVSKWESMVNEIEVYQTIKKVVIDSFKSVLESMPPQIRSVVQNKIDALEGYEAIYSFEELGSFLSFASICSTSILSNLDDKDIPDYAAPHYIVVGLDTLVQMQKSNADKNVRQLGAGLVGAMYGLRERILKTDWKKGWR